jgi:hypothetical protein
MIGTFHASSQPVGVWRARGWVSKWPVLTKTCASSVSHISQERSSPVGSQPVTAGKEVRAPMVRGATAPCRRSSWAWPG